jgi:hypothetical protein
MTNSLAASLLVADLTVRRPEANHLAARRPVANRKVADR